MGMSPEKKSLIFLPMSPIGLSSAWLGERGWWGVRVRLCLATSQRRRRWRVGTAGAEELRRTSEERDGHTQGGHEG